MDVGKGQAIRGIARTDEVAECERVSRERLRSTYDFRVMQDGVDAGKLLHRQHSQREQQPCAGTSFFAAKAVVEQSNDDQSEICLGLAATCGEPEDVNRVELLT